MIGFGILVKLVQPVYDVYANTNLMHIMRTNIVIDPDLMAAAMKAGPYTTKKDAVEAGLKLLARQAAYREILKWEGKLRWEGDEGEGAPDWRAAAAPLQVQEPAPATTVVARRARR